MTIRKKDTRWSTHPWIQELSLEADHLYDYLNFNDHCSPSGLYKISLRTIASESKVPIEKLPEALKELEKNVAWYPELNLIWAKEFLNHQTSKDHKTFLDRVASSLKDIKHPEIIKEFLAYNLERYGIEIPYTGGQVSSILRQDQVSESAAKETDTLLIPTPFEMELLEVIKTFTGWEYQENEDLAWIRELTQDFQNVTVALLKTCRDRNSDSPTKKGHWKSRTRNWLKKDTEFSKEKQGGTHRRGSRQLRPRSTYTKPEDL